MDTSPKSQAEFLEQMKLMQLQITKLQKEVQQLKKKKGEEEEKAIILGTTPKEAMKKMRDLNNDGFGEEGVFVFIRRGRKVPQKVVEEMTMGGMELFEKMDFEKDFLEREREKKVVRRMLLRKVERGGGGEGGEWELPPENEEEEEKENHLLEISKKIWGAVVPLAHIISILRKESKETLELIDILRVMKWSVRDIFEIVGEMGRESWRERRGGDWRESWERVEDHI